MKKFVRNLIFVFVCAAMVLTMASCGVKHETVSQKSADYKFIIGERVDIKDSGSKKTIGNLTITSCQMMYDGPFIIAKQISSGEGGRYSSDNYNAMYKITYKLVDSKDFIKEDFSSHFRSNDENFAINPKGLDDAEGILYVGVKAGNKQDSVMSIGFVYDTAQESNTANFDILLDEIAEEAIFDKSTHTIVSGYKEGSAPKDANAADGEGGNSAGDKAFLTMAIAAGALGVLFFIVFPVLSFVWVVKYFRIAKKFRKSEETIKELKKEIRVLKGENVDDDDDEDFDDDEEYDDEYDEEYDDDEYDDDDIESEE